MDAMQTFWTTPGVPAEAVHGGWLDPRFHLMSWALSASLLADHFGKVILHTDLQGAAILGDALELPYSSIHITQEGLGAIYPPHWWVMRKMQSYALAEGPFIHVDGDAFLWNGLPAHLCDKPLIAQNSQNGFQCYRIAANQLRDAGIAMPDFMDYRPDAFEAVNMGVVGGTDPAFFRGFFDAVKTFYDRHLAGRSFSNGTTGFLNTLIEECFFSHYAGYNGQTVAAWISDDLSQGYGPLANSMNARFGLTHLIGTNKKDIYFCKQIEFQLKRRYPAAYRSVARMVDSFSGRSRQAFSFPQTDPFTESNIAAAHIAQDVQVTAGNCDEIVDRFTDSHADFVQIVAFESAKHRSFQTLLENTEPLDARQQERLAAISTLLNAPVAARKDDLIWFDEAIPLMRFTYPSKKTPYHLATLYEFSFGYRHIAHRALDDLAIFILVSASEPARIASVANALAAKSASAPDEVARAAALEKIDLKIKELVFLGLLEYLPAVNAPDFAHENAASC